jgi:hypothetical protein
LSFREKGSRRGEMVFGGLKPVNGLPGGYTEPVCGIYRLSKLMAVFNQLPQPYGIKGNLKNHQGIGAVLYRLTR